MAAINNNFLDSPIQSVQLQTNLNIILPQPLLHADVNNNPIIQERKRVALNYCIDLDNLKRQFPRTVTPDDLTSASSYMNGIDLALKLPEIARHVHGIAENNILAAIGEVQRQIVLQQQQLTQLQQQQVAMQQQQVAMQVQTAQALIQINNISIKNDNLASKFDDDPINPPVNGDNPGVEFPRTILELRNLSAGPLLIAVENYYNLVHTGTLTTRKNRIRRAYGVRIDI